MRVGLVLNSCFFGFYAHLGFARELETAGIVFDAFGGSSAGALVAAALASGMTAKDTFERTLFESTTEFWDPDPWPSAIVRLGLVRGDRIERILEKVYPVARIEDCPRPLVVTATALPLLEPLALSRGPLARSVRASMAVPFLIQPVDVEGRLCVDGGVRNDAPLSAVLDRTPLDAVVVHAAYWRRPEERTKDPPRLTSDLARAVRKARARGVRVLVSKTVYPRLEPDKLHRAGEAVLAGERSARALLERGGLDAPVESD
jgi:NTE family protein